MKKENKAYGVYSGSYDGGGVSNPLYWNIDYARKECLEQVKLVDAETNNYLNNK